MKGIWHFTEIIKAPGKRIFRAYKNNEYVRDIGIEDSKRQRFARFFRDKIMFVGRDLGDECECDSCKDFNV